MQIGRYNTLSSRRAFCLSLPRVCHQVQPNHSLDGHTLSRWYTAPCTPFLGLTTGVFSFAAHRCIRALKTVQTEHTAPQLYTALHRRTCSSVSAPRITTHYTIHPRDKDPRWEGKTRHYLELLKNVMLVPTLKTANSANWIWKHCLFFFHRSCCSYWIFLSYLLFLWQESKWRGLPMRQMW